MKARGVVGKRIIRIEQYRVQTPSGPAMHIAAIVLEDGTRMRPFTSQMEDEDPAIDMRISRRKSAIEEAARR